MLLSENAWDTRLWWIMLGFGIAAVMVSTGVGYAGRKQMGRMSDRQRFLLHMLSYVLMSVSILAFIVRGLSAPG